MIARLVIILAGLALTASLIGPILFAIFIAILAFPILFRLMKKELPKGIAHFSIGRLHRFHTLERDFGSAGDVLIDALNGNCDLLTG